MLCLIDEFDRNNMTLNSCKFLFDQVIQIAENYLTNTIKETFISPKRRAIYLTILCWDVGLNGPSEDLLNTWAKENKYKVSDELKKLIFKPIINENKNDKDLDDKFVLF